MQIGRRKDRALVDGDYILMEPRWLAKELCLPKEKIEAWLDGEKIPKRLCRTLEKITGVFEEAWREPDKYENKWLEIWKRKYARIIESRKKRDEKKRPPF